MALIADLETRLTANNTNFNEQMASSMESVKKLGEAFAVFEAAKIAIEGLEQGFDKLLEIIDQGVEKVTQLAETSKKLSVGVGALQELEYAAGQVGVSVSALDRGIGFMQKTLGTAFQGRAGSENLIKDLDQIGLSITQLKALAPDQQFNELAKSIGAVEDPAVRAKLAMDIFGRGGIQLMGLFKSNVTDLRSEFAAFGGELTGEQAESVKSYSDSVRKLGAIWDAFTMQLAVAVSGPFKQVIDWLIQTIEKMGGVGKAAQTFAGYIIQGVQAAISALASFANSWDSIIIKMEQVIKLALEINKYATLGLSTLVTNTNSDIEALNKDMADRQRSIKDRTDTSSSLGQGLTSLNSQITNNQQTSQSQQKVNVEIQAGDGFIARVSSSSQINNKIDQSINRAFSGAAAGDGK